MINIDLIKADLDCLDETQIDQIVSSIVNGTPIAIYDNGQYFNFNQMMEIRQGWGRTLS